MKNKERAMRVIEQLHAGEWKYEWNSGSKEFLTAERNGVELWCGNGPFWTDIDNTGNYFGYFWRHIVWWFGIRPTRNALSKRYKQMMKNVVDEKLNKY